MKKIIRLRLVTATIFLATFVAGSSLFASEDRGVVVARKVEESRKRIALVIGNSSYHSLPLKNPANDAKAIADSLRRLGFEVEEKTNLGFISMNEAVERFGKDLRPGGVGLFYYAGHGMQVNGINYLIPVDAEVNDENEVRYKAVDAGLVLAKMEQSKSDVNIVILDACRDNPFARSFRSTTRGLANMEAPTGTFIAYATAPGKTAADGAGRNGLYTSELVKVVGTAGLKLEDVFKLTLKAVREKSKGKQTPWVASNLEKDFWFLPPSGKSDAQPATFSDQELPATASPARAGASSVKPAGPPADKVTGIEFVNVPAGCFQMGDFRGEKNSPLYILGSSEHPVHKVCLTPFAIGKFPVTQGQWRKIMGNNPANFINCGEDCPVENVSWHDVQEFIEKLNKRSGMSYRLPTEAEWEYACRSGGNNEKYCGGNEIDDLAWYNRNSGEARPPDTGKLAWVTDLLGHETGAKTHPVGQKDPNGLGIYDMSGNVWQWVQDWYDRKYYTSSPAENPAGPAIGKLRVCRGGSWADGSGDARASNRDGREPGDRARNVGFRLVAPL